MFLFCFTSQSACGEAEIAVDERKVSYRKEISQDIVKLKINLKKGLRADVA